MITNLDEAIAHAREKAEEQKKQGSICCDSLEDTIRAEKCLECAAEHEQLAEWLTELKQRREADRWIPVSERLPDEYGEYMITYRLMKGQEVVRKDIYNDHFKRFNEGSCVIAWKPLPEPYKENDK